MTTVITRDVVYEQAGVTCRGLLLTPGAATTAGAAVLLVHDAFGLGGFTLEQAHRFAAAGYVVFAADMWGERLLPGEAEIGPLIGGFAGDHAAWRARIAAAHEAAVAQPEVDPTRVAGVGYCFGGSTVLEHARAGAPLRGAVGIHSGLDLLDVAASWEAARARVLLCTGAEDPMATPAQRDRLQDAMSAAGVVWEVDLYAQTVHAFTNPRLADSPRPEVVAYNARSAERADRSTLSFLADVLA